MWRRLNLRKRIIFSAIALVSAIILTLSREIDTHRNAETREVRAAQFRNLTALMTLRMSRKSDELRGKGVKQPELKKLLDQEQEQTRLEANKVLASHFQKPFDMNPLNTKIPR